MKGKMKLDEKGITLVALVVTVIILLILAGVTINIALSENGLFQKARKTAEEHNISEYLDRLKLASSSATLERQEKGFNTKEYMDFYAEEIKNDEKFKEADVSRVSEEKTETEVEEKIVVTTKEGYVFSVTEGEIEYLGKQGEKGLEEPPKLKEGDIKISQTPKEWTKETVEVEITTEITEYTLQYSLNGTNWYNYRGKLTIENNKTTVYGRLVNKLGQANGYASKEISTIDREAPNEINPTGIGNPTTIEVKVTATDKEETSKDGKSGIKKIYFSIYKDGNWVEEEEAGEDGKEVTHTFDKLNSETEYQIKVIAEDEAKNRTEKEIKVTTTIETYQITYNANGGEGGPTTGTKRKGETAQISDAIPKRAGYIFKGWATSLENANVETVNYTSGADYTVDEDLNLWAVWKKNELKQNEYVNYIDKNGTTRKCIVLYDANSSYGLQIITDKTVEKVNLGGGVGNGNSTVQEYNAARNSYNNTVIYLNDLANTYVNLKYSEEKSARSVGTVPNNPYLEVGYFAAKYTSDKLRATDTYYSTDVEELKKLNILNIGEEYFLASRYCFNGEYTTDFCLRFVGASGGVSYICVCSARSNGTVYGRTLSYGLRPIFKLKENVLIDTGDGTFDNPYNLTVEE